MSQIHRHSEEELIEGAKIITATTAVAETIGAEATLTC